MKKVTLQISEEEFAFAQRLAREDGYSGPADCLNGILNTALMGWMNPCPDDAANNPLVHVLKLQEVRISVLRDMLFESLRENIRREGGRRELTEEEIRGPLPNGSGALDDGIPF